MRITGTLHTIGNITICENHPQDFHDDLNFDNVQGILIATGDKETHEAMCNLLAATVDIYPHPVNGLVAGECTPENYAHALARLAHAEEVSPTADHLAREVRSSQALMVVNEGLRLMNDGYHAEVQDLRTEVKRLRRMLHKHNISADTSGEENDEGARDSAWAEYLDLRKQIRKAAAEDRADSEEQHTLVARALDIARLHNFDPPTRALEEAQAQHAALLAKQAEQERLMKAYRVKYHEAERALNKTQASLGWTQALLARCVPPDFGVVPALSYGDDVRENAWSWWWETNTPSEDDKIALARGDLEDESKLGTIQTSSPTSFDDEDDCDRYTPRGG